MNLRDSDETTMPPGNPPPPSSQGDLSNDMQIDSQENTTEYRNAASALPDFPGRSTYPGVTQRLVEQDEYRDVNLAMNNIHLLHPSTDFPEDIGNILNRIRQARDSPGPSLDEVQNDSDLHDLWMSAAELDVEDYFKSKIFLNPKKSDSLKRSDRAPMARNAVPPRVGQNPAKVSYPIPDRLYRYNLTEAFSFPQRKQLRSMGTPIPANRHGLIYPFLLIEFKGDDSGGARSFWVATNQCLGGAATCLNVVEHLNTILRQLEKKKAKVHFMKNVVFSIALSGTEARLHISWKHDAVTYHMAKVEDFALQKPKDYLEFRQQVLNIIDWGKDERLKGILRTVKDIEITNASTSKALKRQRSDDVAIDDPLKRRRSARFRRRGEGEMTDRGALGFNFTLLRTLIEY